MNKYLKYLFWAIAVCFATYYVLDLQGEGEVIETIKNVTLYVAIGLVVLAAIILVLTSIENKKISKMLDADDYDGVIAFTSKKLESKSVGFDRKQYYIYLILLSYFGLNDNDNINKYYDMLDAKTYFPIVYYWKGCQEVANGNLEGAKLFPDFSNNKETRKNAMRYTNIFTVIDAITNYANGNLVEAKAKANEVEIERLSMPASKKCIQTIRDLSIEEKGNNNTL